MNFKDWMRACGAIWVCPACEASFTKSRIETIDPGPDGARRCVNCFGADLQKVLYMTREAGEHPC